MPVAFGVLTVDTVEQAEERLGKGGEAARAALEMADIFSQVRSPGLRASESRLRVGYPGRRDVEGLRNLWQETRLR